MHKTDEQFLSDMYRGAKMGVQTIESVIQKISDSKMKNELVRQQHDFKKFELKAMDELIKIGCKPADIPMMQKIGGKMGIIFNTAVDSTPSHIADLMIQGNNMGIIGIQKLKNSAPDNGYASLAQDFIDMQQQNIEQLKSYL